MNGKLYRYEDRVYSTCSIDPGGGEHYGTTPVKVELSEFEVKKETPCGFWIGCGFSKKWVSKTSRKRFAHPSRELALDSFKKRKTVQLRIYEARAKRAREALGLAANITTE